MQVSKDILVDLVGGLELEHDEVDADERAHKGRDFEERVEPVSASIEGEVPLVPENR